MRNPWIKKKPYLSMWLSASNAAIGAASGHAMAQAKRQQAAASKAATRQVAEIWSAAMFGVSPKAKKRRR
jgi:hypothetical protein